jgi:hypothetical protein
VAYASTTTEFGARTWVKEKSQMKVTLKICYYMTTDELYDYRKEGIAFDGEKLGR